METIKKIGLAMIIIAIAMASFGLWLKSYNDKLVVLQVNETGSCYLDDGTCLHATSDTIFLSMSGIAAILAVLGLYMFFRKNPVHALSPKSMAGRTIAAEQKKAEAPRTLTAEYRKIFDAVAESDGAILQGELVTKSGMDKVKVSRILDKLEMQGLIERRRHGMSNLVVLKKK